VLSRASVKYLIYRQFRPNLKLKANKKPLI
ncbi:MAG: hypothetical protein ACI9E5_000907, partial [Candidatus Omnitrophota bacterium]